MGREVGDGHRGRLLLIGAGHAHLEVIRRLGGRGRNGHEATVVAPEDFWYSGLATGMLGGAYPVDADRVDLVALTRRVGVELVRDRVEAIDPARRAARLGGGGTLEYDAASLDVGSSVPTDRVAGLAEHAFAVKPIRRLAELRADLERRFRARPEGGDPVRVLVIGDGPAACEVSANVLRLAGRGASAAAVTLAAASDRLLSEFPAGASRAVEDRLRRGGVELRYRSRIVRVMAGMAEDEWGDRIPFDVAVAATGLVPPPLVRDLGLPTDPRGALLVDETLRSVAEPTLFGGGDCVALRGRTQPTVGIVAVRQATILAHNLLATLNGRRLRRYRPQRRYLLILNLGDGTGLARWGPYWYRGRAAIWFKDRLDRSFLKRYQ